MKRRITEFAVDLLVVSSLDVIDERTILQRHQTNIRFDSIVRDHSLRLQWQFQFDAVACFPLTRNNGIALADDWRFFFSINCEPLYASDRGRIFIKLARRPVWNSYIDRKRLRLFWIYGD